MKSLNDTIVTLVLAGEGKGGLLLGAEGAGGGAQALRFPCRSAGEP